METVPKSYPIARFLVRWRHLLFAVTAVLAVLCGLLIPRTNINSDVTDNLPDNSPMRQGLEILGREFPAMDIRMQTLRVMFSEAPADSLMDAVMAVPGVARCIGLEQNDSLTLYQFMLPRDVSGKAVVAAVKGRFPGRAVVELDDNTYIPDNFFVMLGSGIAIALLILFLMCPSFVEPVLLLFALLVAVVINMGTNSFLPSVFLVTHILSAVLQMVLSMDFAIILMNRYRQEKREDRTNEEAMAQAIAAASSSILSSGLTTIVSMLMLVFMRLKIGADLGFVLSKGVLCSLVATFTVLPALILRFDKAIVKTKKPVLTVSTDGLARLEYRLRVPLTLLFFGIFIGSWYLQKQTTISYSINYEPTQITRLFPPKNMMVVLFDKADEEAFIPVAERISREPEVISCLSYPSIALQKRTAPELADLASLIPGMRDSIPMEALNLLYYSVTHPERKERMRLDELEPTARNLLAEAGKFLPEETLSDLASRFDISAITRKLTEQIMAVPEDYSQPEEPAPETAGVPDGTEGPDTAVPDSVALTTVPAPKAPADSSSIVHNVSVPDNEPIPELTAADLAAINKAYSEGQAISRRDSLAILQYFSYDNITRQRSADDMAAFLGQDKRQTSLVYRIARKKTMSAKEFLQVISDKILGNKLYSSMLSEDQKDMVRTAMKELESITPAPSDTLSAAPSIELVAQAPDSLSVNVPAVDSIQTPSVAEKAVPVVAVTPDEPSVPTPLERLTEMAFSGKRYTSKQIYRALHDAGVGVSPEELDFLFLYKGYSTERDTSARLNLLELGEGIKTFAANPLLKQNLDSAALAQIEALPATLESELDVLHGDNWSLATIISDLPGEGERTFGFLDTLDTMLSEHLEGESHELGFSVMYKEIKEGFARELLLLTLLTAAAIFLIVALTFRSLIVPFILIPTVMSAVWMNVYASGWGGNTLLYVAYLIVQGILMGATIDYSILFTQCYRDARKSLGKEAALKAAYRKSFHAILTSGMILILTPLLMTQTLTDPLIVSVLSCISVGALAATLMVYFVLPASLTLFDRWVCRHETTASE